MDDDWDWDGTSSSSYCDGSCWDEASCTCTPDEDPWDIGW